jgi:hypothetical protein
METVMFKSLKSYLMNSLWGGHDEERRRETPAQDVARMLEMDEPMAGAGAQISGMHEDSETELALKRATSREES